MIQKVELCIGSTGGGALDLFLILCNRAVEFNLIYILYSRKLVSMKMPMTSIPSMISNA